MSKKLIGSVSHHDCEVEELRADRELAVEYAKVAVEALNNPEDRAAGLIALRAIAEASGLNVIATDARINCKSLHRALSPKGNPTLTVLQAVLKAVGLKLSVASGQYIPL